MIPEAGKQRSLDAGVLRSADVEPAKESAVESEDSGGPPKSFGAAKDEYTDDRKPWEWQSRYPVEAQRSIKAEAIVLAVMLVIVLSFAAICVGLSGAALRVPFTFLSPISSSAPTSSDVPGLNIDFRIMAIFFTGWVGGTTFSIKWLVHAVATGRWHLDRKYWRLLVPGLGGVYACVVLTLFDAGLFGPQQAAAPRSLATAAALSFLVGYFSDGVSGLLSNIANAVFGTLEKK